MNRLAPIVIGTALSQHCIVIGDARTSEWKPCRRMHAENMVGRCAGAEIDMRKAAIVMFRELSNCFANAVMCCIMERMRQRP